LVDRPLFGERPGRVVVLCWGCGQVVELAAVTAAADDPEGFGFAGRGALPVEHRPYLGVGTSGTRTLAGSVEPQRVAGCLLYLEAWLWPGSADPAPSEWLVADGDGNVLGVVHAYVTRRGATRYGWGVLDGLAQGEDCTSPRAAARRLIDAAIGTGTDGPAGVGGGS
jgi:hypothetical protein